MKKLFVCATAIGLFLTLPTLAADDHHGDAHGGAAPSRASSAPARATHENGPAHATMGAAHSNTGFARQNAPVRATQSVAHTRTATTHQTRPAVALGTNGNAGGANTRRSNTGGAGASAMSAARTGQHASINSLRLNVQASHQYHDGNYTQPAGYQSRRWSYGERVPHSYYARDYWLMDYLTFGLFAPPDGLVWIRVGDDALLVDEISGDIVQVDYGVFY